MRITMEQTEHIVGLTQHGVRQDAEVTLPARIWTGTTDRGIKVYIFVTRLAVRAADDTAQFERELKETPLMRAGLEDLFPHGIPARLVL